MRSIREASNWQRMNRKTTKRGFPLTVTPFEAQAGRNSVNHDEANHMTAIILDETFELLDLLSDRAPDVLLSFGIHIHVWPSDTKK